MTPNEKRLFAWYTRRWFYQARGYTPPLPIIATRPPSWWKRNAPGWDTVLLIAGNLGLWGGYFYLYARA